MCPPGARIESQILKVSWLLPIMVSGNNRPIENGILFKENRIFGAESHNSTRELAGD
jgi:hypothetical protein